MSSQPQPHGRQVNTKKRKDPQRGRRSTSGLPIKVEEMHSLLHRPRCGCGDPASSEHTQWQSSRILEDVTTFLLDLECLHFPTVAIPSNTESNLERTTENSLEEITNYLKRPT